ncbi:MAG: hypothetical protein A2539_10465 [Elusimicrobia bacterium RIFOXYD2_FULL_34_15]|nr:MAG: hypothetical protein A2539_10465 [Elusimicrobia bacterium RIFOXYD2_FULL_34_15]
MTKFYKFTLILLNVLFIFNFGIAKEIGDVMYVNHYMWGMDNQYEFPTNIGHSAIFIGVDESSKTWIIESPGGDEKVKRTIIDENYHYPLSECSYYKTSVNLTKEQRKNIIKIATSKEGWAYCQPTPFPFWIPNVNEQKGYSYSGEGKISCVGLVENAYEQTNINITPDNDPNEGRDLVRENEPLYTTWNEKEGSYVNYKGIPLLDGWVFFPYTQWYKQSNKQSNLNVMRMFPATSSPVNSTIKCNSRN